MHQAQQLVARLEEVFLSGKWIANTNYRELLDGVSLEQATTSLPQFNSIAKLTFHINYYLDGLIRAFQTGTLDIKDQYSFDLPPLQTEEDWDQLRATLLNNSKVFSDLVSAMEDSHLDAPFIDARYGTVLRNIEAVIEHSYYHLGQIRLIKKWIEGQTESSFRSTPTS